MKCPHCQQLLVDPAERCPHCGRLLAEESAFDSAQTSGTLDSDVNASSVTLQSDNPDSFGELPDEFPADDERGGSVDATFLADEWAEHEVSPAERTIQSIPPDSGTAELDEDERQRMIALNRVQRETQEQEGRRYEGRGSGSSDLDSASHEARPLATSDQTIASVSDESDRGGDSSQTLLSDDAPSPEELRTIQSQWGGSGSEPPRMTIKSQGDVSFDNSGAFGDSLSSVPRRTLRTQGDLASASQLAEYELLKVLGEGGMGVVWSARQTSVDRKVAVKMIKGPHADKRSQRQKFLAEAVVTGDLDHPNIVPIYDVGTDVQGTLFYSMKQVQGISWLKVIKEKSVHENLEILLRVADAVGFAHSRHIIHRDLKPENVMLGEYGEVLVMDWGLALALGELDKARQLRQSTSMGGTPAYMAPEMATGPIERITVRSDVYLLGAILWEIINGKPPHPGKRVQECLLAAMRNHIVPSDVKGELADIARKAMATSPLDRHANVKEFQQEIRDYLSHSESVAMAARAKEDLDQARISNDYRDYAKAVFGFEEAAELWEQNDTARQGLNSARIAYAENALSKEDYDLASSLLDAETPEHAGLLLQIRNAQTEREARKHRLRIAKRLSATLAAMMLVVATTAFFWIRSERNFALGQQRIAEQERDSAQAARVQEEAAKVEAEQARVQEAEQRLAAEQATELAVAARKDEEYEGYIARVGLAAAKIEENAFDVARELLNECPVELRNWEWGRLMHLCEQASEIFEAEGPVDAVAISPDGKQILVGSWDHRARVWDLKTQELLLELPQQGLYVHSVAWSPDQRTLATAGNDSAGQIRLWNAQTGQELARLNGHQDAVVGVRFSPDGRWLLTSSYDQSVRMWDLSNLAAPREAMTLSGHSWWVWGAEFAPGFNLLDAGADNRIVTSSHDGQVIVWAVVPRDVSTGEAPMFEGRQGTVFSGHNGPVFTAIFSPDGRTVASAGDDRRILIWAPEEIPPFNLENLVAGKSEQLKFRELSGHIAPIRSLAFSQDGRILVSGSRDNSVKAWSVETGKSVKTFRGHHSGVRSVALTPDGRQIVSGGQDQRAIVWSVDDYEEIRVLDGRKLAGHNDAILNAGYSLDGRMIFTASRDRTARTWDATTGRMLHTFEEGHDFLTSRAVFFPGGRFLATAAADNSVRIWSVATGTQSIRLDRTGRSAVLALSHQADWLATGGEDNDAKLWSVRSLRAAFDDHDDDEDHLPEPRIVQGHNGRITAMAFSPTDDLLLTCDANGRSILRRVGTDKILWNKRHHTRRINACGFTRDGAQILTASNDHTVSRVDVETGEEIPSLILKHQGAVVALDLSPDGRHALTVEIPDATEARETSVVRMWNLADAGLLNEFKTTGYRVNNITFIPSAESALGVCSDNAIRRFPLFGAPSLDELRTPWLDFKKEGGLVWFAIPDPASSSVLTVGGNEARLWDLGSRRQKMSFSPHGAVAAAAFSPSGEQLVTGSWDNSAKIWSTETAQALKKLENGHDGYLNSVQYSPDGKWILTASDDGLAKLWDAATGAVIQTYRGHTGRVRQATFSPQGDRVLTVSNDRTARLWDAVTGTPIGESLQGHRWAVLCGAFSPDGARILTGSEDNDARLWDAATGEMIAVFPGHTAAVTSVAFSADGQRVFTASQDNTAKLWDASPRREGQEILSLSGHSQELTSIAVSPNGRQLLTASRDGTAVIWLTSDWKSTESQASSAPTPR